MKGRHQRVFSDVSGTVAWCILRTMPKNRRGNPIRFRFQREKTNNHGILNSIEFNADNQNDREIATTTTSLSAHFT